jgi:hypothetical protein
MAHRLAMSVVILVMVALSAVVSVIGPTREQPRAATYSGEATWHGVPKDACSGCDCGCNLGAPCTCGSK